MSGTRYERMKKGFKSWLERRQFGAHKLRGVLVSCVSTAVVCEVACYRQLQSAVRAGHLPAYVPDIAIVTLALLETLISPFVSWLGYRRRRTIMVSVLPVLMFSVISWLILPTPEAREESEFCNGSINFVYRGVTGAAAFRLAFVLCTCALFLAARAAVWAHGLAYIEEHAPERLSLHLGVLVFVRVLSLLIDQRMVALKVKNSQIIGFAVTFFIQTLQMLYAMPMSTLREQEKKVPTDGRSLFPSIIRVLSDPLAFTQMISLGLLAGALWGFGYHSSDIIKVKFNIVQQNSATIFFTELFLYFVVLMCALYVGVKWSAPVLTEFCKLKALKQSVTMCVLALIFYVVLVVTVTCDTGLVAGLTQQRYSNPECSLNCGCTARWKEYYPVCVVEDMTSYLSPCHAGCTGAEEINGIRVYSNCTCGYGGRALEGACSDAQCRPSSALHHALYVLLVTVSALAFQAHGMVLVKGADPRDKSVVLGLAGACVAGLSFVCGHLVFMGISMSTCVWSENGHCHMHSHMFPLMVGATSAVMVTMALAICLTTYICLRVANKKYEATRL